MSFRKNSTDSVLDGLNLKVTSQFDVHVYICERSAFNILAYCIEFSTIIQEVFHVYLNKFKNDVTHLFLVILGIN